MAESVRFPALLVKTATELTFKRDLLECVLNVRWPISSQVTQKAHTTKWVMARRPNALEES